MRFRFGKWGDKKGEILVRSKPIIINCSEEGRQKKKLFNANRL